MKQKRSKISCETVVMLFTLGLLEANCCLLQLPHHKNDDGELGGSEYRGLSKRFVSCKIYN